MARHIEAVKIHIKQIVETMKEEYKHFKGRFAAVFYEDW